MELDDQAVAKNQQTLEALLDNGDKKFISAVGVTALAILAEQMPPQEYDAFLSRCIDKAHELQKYKSLNARAKAPDEQQQNTQGQPPAATGGELAQ